MQASSRPKADPDTSLMSLVQWLSPAFPTGAFAYSHGLEVLMARGDIHDAASLAQAAQNILTHGAGRTDAILLAHAMRPDTDLPALSDLASALAASAERLREMRELGRALGLMTNALLGADHPEMPYAVALGAAARTLDLPPEQVLRLFLQAFAASLVSAAVRFVPLGQTEGQQVLAGLAPLILQIATDAAIAPLDAIHSATFRADMASAQHETLDVRIFRT